MADTGTGPVRPGFIDRLRTRVAGVLGLPGLDGAPYAVPGRPLPPRLPGPGNRPTRPPHPGSSGRGSIRNIEGNDALDKDRVIGSAKVVKGKAKVAIGKAIGDSKLESEGEADKIEGRIQNAVGGIKDTIRDA